MPDWHRSVRFYFPNFKVNHIREPLVVPDDWVSPDLPPMPPEIAKEVVAFTRWKVKCYADELDQSTES